MINNQLQEVTPVGTLETAIAFIFVVAGVTYSFFEVAGLLENVGELQTNIEELSQSIRDTRLLLSEVTNPIRQSHELLIVTPHMYAVTEALGNINQNLENLSSTYAQSLQLPPHVVNPAEVNQLSYEIDRLIIERDELNNILRIPRAVDHFYRNYARTAPDENITDFMVVNEGLLAEYEKFSAIIDKIIEMKNNINRS